MVKDNKILISEIFKSIDGEGFHSGQPTVFIRTFGCNLRCPYCDTKTTWTEAEHTKTYGRGPVWMTVEEIITRVNELEEGFINKSVCVTGGEPLVEENKEFMKRLFDVLIDHDYAVNVETNGSVDYSDYILNRRSVINCDLYGNRIGLSLITDWKLPSSKMNKQMVESNLKILTQLDVIKMVVTDDEEDWKEVERVCKKAENAKIYLSPCFGQVEMNKIPEFVIAHPEYNITAQLQIHKFFWDPSKIGV